MPGANSVQQRFESQLVWWYRRWRYWLIAFMVLTWLPVLIYLAWELRVASFYRQYGFLWFPQAWIFSGKAWEQPLLTAAYHMDYYAHFLRRILAIIAALGLGAAYQLDPRSLHQMGAAQAYRLLRHEVRGAVYGWMIVLSLMPSVASKLIRSVGLAPSGADLTQLTYSLAFLFAEWLTLCEFQQWLLLRHYGRPLRWHYLIALPLTILCFYTYIYLQPFSRWGAEHVAAYFPHLLYASVMAAMLGGAALWWWLARTARHEFAGRVAASHATALRATAKQLQTNVAYRLRQWLPAIGFIVVLGCVWLAVLRSGVLYDPDCYPDPDLTIPYARTRGDMYYGQLKPGVSSYSYELVGRLPCMETPVGQPQDLLIVIHGFNNRELKAQYMFDLARDSAEHAGYTGELAGFSWDANTQHDPLSATGYHAGDRHAALNGPKLARCIVDVKLSNPALRVHVIGYSMGARMALEALYALSNDEVLSRYGVKVDTVHLFGASVNREEVELGERYGEAIENSAGSLYNYYSPTDVALGSFYWIKQTERSLGEADIEDPARKPENYVSVDATAELLTFDKNFKVESAKTGQNHKGYLGQKDPQGKLLDDGAVSLVVDFIQAGAETDGHSQATTVLVQ